MPVTINGTTGIAGVDGSNTTPAIKGGTSTGTGVFYGTNTVSLATGGTTAVTVDSSQNVGIGTASPGYALDVQRASGSAVIRAKATGTANAYFLLDTSASAYEGYMLFNYNGTETSRITSNASNYLSFGTGSSGTERARIDSSGNLLVGTTSALLSGNSSFVNSAGGNGTQVTFRSTGSTAGKYYKIGASGDPSPYFILQNESNVGMYVAPGSTSWTGTSDENLKDISSEISEAITKVNSLRAVYFTWKADEAKEPKVGLIAQDVQKVLPEATNKGSDGHLGIQYSDVIPLLVAAIKELSAKLDAAEARIAALEAN